MIDAYDFDREVRRRGLSVGPPSLLELPLSPLEFRSSSNLAGVDEAGRGPLAGPVVAAAVILRDSPKIWGLRDSKVIPSEQREALYCEILETARATSVSVIGSAIIDEINILGASLRAMREAIKGLPLKPGCVLVDGNQKPGSGFKEYAVIKGDAKSAAVMAASIMAKVTRDQWMIRAHQTYPQYGFDEHKGYGVSDHLRAIKKYGPCPLHRKSFSPLREINFQSLPLQKGGHGEELSQKLPLEKLPA